jgi:hypothetical protein
MKRETKAAKQARQDFYEAVLSKGGCWIARGIIPHACDGPKDPAHIIAKQGLKTEANLSRLSDEDTLGLVWDSRNGIPICRAYHHKLDNGFIRIYQPELPESVFDFIADWGPALSNPSALQSRLDNHYPQENRP